MKKRLIWLGLITISSCLLNVLQAQKPTVSVTGIQDEVANAAADLLQIVGDTANTFADSAAQTLELKEQTTKVLYGITPRLALMISAKDTAAERATKLFLQEFQEDVSAAASSYFLRVEGRGFSSCIIESKNISAKAVIDKTRPSPADRLNGILPEIRVTFALKLKLFRLGVAKGSTNDTDQPQQAVEWTKWVDAFRPDTVMGIFNEQVTKRWAQALDTVFFGKDISLDGFKFVVIMRPEKEGQNVYRITTDTKDWPFRFISAPLGTDVSPINDLAEPGRTKALTELAKDGNLTATAVLATEQLNNAKDRSQTNAAISELKKGIVQDDPMARLTYGKYLIVSKEDELEGLRMLMPPNPMKGPGHAITRAARMERGKRILDNPKATSAAIADSIQKDLDDVIKEEMLRGPPVPK